LLLLLALRDEDRSDRRHILVLGSASCLVVLQRPMHAGIHCIIVVHNLRSKYVPSHHPCRVYCVFTTSCLNPLHPPSLLFPSPTSIPFISCQMHTPQSRLLSSDKGGPRPSGDTPQDTKPTGGRKEKKTITIITAILFIIRARGVSRHYHPLALIEEEDHH